MKKLFLLLIVVLASISCKENQNTTATNEDINEIVKDDIDDDYTQMQNINVTSISHATFVMTWDDQVIYFDPTGGAAAFEGMPAANLILVTDIHGDHMNAETLMAVKTDNNTLIAPQAVADKLDAGLSPMIMNNGESKTYNGITVTAIPMYNITEGRLDKHPKGRGNGYVLEKDGYRVYVSGDTEGIPEMRNLENINKAFVCMNLPYTMDVEQAADAVLEFAPDEVIPYHYRGSNGFSDVENFRSLVNQGNEDIKVTMMEWYPGKAE